MKFRTPALGTRRVPLGSSLRGTVIGRVRSVAKSGNSPARGPGLSGEKPPQAQTGSGAGGHRTKHPDRSQAQRTLPTWVQVGLKSEVLLATPAGAQKPDRSQIRCTRRPDPPAASPCALQPWARAAKGRRSARWVSVSRPLLVQNQHDSAARRGQVDLTNAGAARLFFFLRKV